MTQLVWDRAGERVYETGVDHGVLYIPDNNGVYATGVAWNGLVTVTESPSGAESSAQYADNIKYLNLVSAEQFDATIEAFTYPVEFDQFDGVASPSLGVRVGQQSRKPFGLAYRTRVGNDTQGTDYGYKIHLIYGAQAAPSEKAYATVNDSPEAITFSWALTTTPVGVTTQVNGVTLKPTATLTFDSTKVQPAALASLEQLLFGTVGADPRLPLPDEAIALFANTQVAVDTVTPTFVAAGGTITIPTVAGVTYRRADTNAVVTGTVVIPTAGASLVIRATPASSGYRFSPTSDNDWSFTRTT